jgi:hypothetical protein
MQSTKTRVLVENHDKAHRRWAWSATSAALAQGPINDTASPTLTCGSAREMSAIVVKRRACVTCHCFFQVYRTVILNRVLEWDHKSGSINRILIFGEYSTNFWTRVRFDSNSDLGEFEFSFRIRVRIWRIILSVSKFRFAEYPRIRIRIRIGRILPHPWCEHGVLHPVDP